MEEKGSIFNVGTVVTVDNKTILWTIVALVIAGGVLGLAIRLMKK